MLSRRQQFFCAHHAQFAVLLRPDRVLPALAARNRQQRHVRIQSMRKISQQTRPFIIRMRRNEKNSRADPRFMDRLDRLRQRLRAEPVAPPHTRTKARKKSSQSRQKFPASDSNSSSSLLKRPLAQHSRAPHINQNTRHHRRKRGQHRPAPRGDKNRNPSRDRQHYRHRIKPHAKRPVFGLPATVQQYQSHRLADELDEAAHGQDGANHREKIEEQTHHHRSRAQSQQRHVRKMLRRMHLAQRSKRNSRPARPRMALANIPASQKTSTRTPAPVSAPSQATPNSFQTFARQIDSPQNSNAPLPATASRSKCSSASKNTKSRFRKSK